MVLVEYCRHGNLHQYLHRHKNSFVNQVHPITGELCRYVCLLYIHRCEISSDCMPHVNRFLFLFSLFILMIL